MDEEPPIRANTTILLGNLASHLSEAAAKRVLLNAFTRALKDSFPPARVAGLKVLFLPETALVHMFSMLQYISMSCPCSILDLRKFRAFSHAWTRLV